MSFNWLVKTALWVIIAHIFYGCQSHTKIEGTQNSIDNPIPLPIYKLVNAIRTEFELQGFQTIVISNDCLEFRREYNSWENFLKGNWLGENSWLVVRVWFEDLYWGSKIRYECWRVEGIEYQILQEKSQLSGRKKRQIETLILKAIERAKIGDN